jgi:predicted methyltransferase
MHNKQKARIKADGRIVNILWGVKKNCDPVMYVAEDTCEVFYADDLEFIKPSVSKEELRSIIKCLINNNYGQQLSTL